MRGTIAVLILVVLSVDSVLVLGEDDEILPPGWKQLTKDGHFKQRPVWSPDGSKLLFTRHLGESVRVILCDADGTNEKWLFENPHPRFDAVFFPDGKRFAFTFDKITPGQGDMELYLADEQGENLQPLFTSEGKLSHEEWASPSPDGNWIACTSTRDENAELYLLKVDGTAKQRLTSDPALDVHPSFSPDGRKIAFATNRWGDFEIALFNLDSSLVTRLTDSPGLDDYPNWSPDGNQISFTSARTGNLDIWLIQSDGSNTRNVTNREGHDNFSAWNRKGEITFCSMCNGAWNLYQLLP